mmetsp:Transcript_10363/g.21013  ORF Transcript_10363/g.21013 Transcript_10363/m.21013 type:complete len:139 (+) Transcript_10363:480-896(+)
MEREVCVLVVVLLAPRLRMPMLLQRDTEEEEEEEEDKVEAWDNVDNKVVAAAVVVDVGVDKNWTMLGLGDKDKVEDNVGHNKDRVVPVVVATPDVGDRDKAAVVVAAEQEEGPGETNKAAEQEEGPGKTNKAAVDLGD